MGSIRCTAVQDCLGQVTFGKHELLLFIFFCFCPFLPDTCTAACSAAGQPRLIRAIALCRLHVRNIVIAKVDVLHVGSWLVVTRYICHRGDGVLLRQHPER